MSTHDWDHKCAGKGLCKVEGCINYTASPVFFDTKTPPAPVDRRYIPAPTGHLPPLPRVQGPNLTPPLRGVPIVAPVAPPLTPGQSVALALESLRVAGRSATANFSTAECAAMHQILTRGLEDLVYFASAFTGSAVHTSIILDRWMKDER